MNKINHFDFNGSNIRVITKGEDLWFVAKDICDVLELTVSDSVRYLDDDEKSYLSRKQVGLNPGRDITIISEPGLYALTYNARKPEAKMFKRWVNHEVLPSIRKNGAYMTDNVLEQSLLDPDYAIGLLINLKQERELRIAETERADFNERTKSQISDKKTATALATASTEKRKANKLAVENLELKEKIGMAGEYRTLSSLDWIPRAFDLKRHKGAKSVIGRALKALSDEEDIPVIKVDDQRYGKVNAYHIDVIEGFSVFLEANDDYLQKYRKQSL